MQTFSGTQSGMRIFILGEEESEKIRGVR